MRAVNFNAGVMSITPSLEKVSTILNYTSIFPMEASAEQGLLNRIFRCSMPNLLNSSIYLQTELLQTYNLNTEAYFSHRSSWDELWPDARIVHFTVRKSRPMLGEWGFGI